jgi:hypothetical protein
MGTRIKIIRQAMNTDRATACGLVIKLTYVFPKRDQPHLEIFPDNEQTRSEEWEIYGAKYDQDGNKHDCVRTIEFSGLNESKVFELNSRFRVQFVGLTEEEIDYPRGGKTMEPVYHFEIEALE